MLEGQGRGIPLMNFIKLKEILKSKIKLRIQTLYHYEKYFIFIFPGKIQTKQKKIVNPFVIDENRS